VSKIACIRFIAVLAFCCCAPSAKAFQGLQHTELPNFDKRHELVEHAKPQDKSDALTRLQARLPGVQVEFKELLQRPSHISAGHDYLSGPKGQGRGISAQALESIPLGDTHRPVRG
jgi:hypothetical protein